MQISPRERENLILQHQTTALLTVKKHTPRGVPRDELRQEALLALVVAVDTFDPAKGVAATVEERLVIHIYWVVRGAITAMARREHRHTEVVDGQSRHVRSHMLRLNDVTEDGQSRMDRLEATTPSPEDIAAHHEIMETAALLTRKPTKKPAKKGKRSQRRVVAGGKKMRVDAEVLALARAM